MRVIISAGGTGGHIYPALSIINKITQRDKHAEILYVGTTNKILYQNIIFHIMQ